MRIRVFYLRICAVFFPIALAGGAQKPATVTEDATTATIKAHLDLQGSGSRRAPKLPPAVLWLQPLSGKPVVWPATGQHSYQLVQKGKMFSPHLLVIRVGSLVSFPNGDPFFHNVFSLFEGKRFDLGLYEAGSTREVRFSNPGISYIFCNIHPTMSAVVIALTTPWSAVGPRVTTRCTSGWKEQPKATWTT